MYQIKIVIHVVLHVHYTYMYMYMYVYVYVVRNATTVTFIPTCMTLYVITSLGSVALQGSYERRCHFLHCWS
jgi:type III secretory pathway component EscR